VLLEERKRENVREGECRCLNTVGSLGHAGSSLISHGSCQAPGCMSELEWPKGFQTASDDYRSASVYLAARDQLHFSSADWQRSQRWK